MVCLFLCHASSCSSAGLYGYEAEVGTSGSAPVVSGAEAGAGGPPSPVTPDPGAAASAKDGSPSPANPAPGADAKGGRTIGVAASELVKIGARDPKISTNAADNSVCIVEKPWVADPNVAGRIFAVPAVSIPVDVYALL